MVSSTAAAPVAIPKVRNPAMPTNMRFFVFFMLLLLTAAYLHLLYGRSYATLSNCKVARRNCQPDSPLDATPKIRLKKN